MVRFIRVLGVVVFGAAFTAACSETGSETPAEAAASQGFATLRGAHFGTSSLALRASLHAAASRLCDLQADSIGDNARNGLVDADPDDGGWDWMVAPASTAHSATTSPENLYGSIGLVPWSLLRGGSRSLRFHTATLDVSLGMQNDADVDSPPDFVYLVLLADLSEDRGFSELAKVRYDARVSAAGGAQAFAESVRDLRQLQGNDGLIAYDLAWLNLAATALDSAFPRSGYDSHASAYAGVVVDDLSAVAPFFDHRDPREPFYVQGLAWSLFALSRDGSAPVLRARLREQLLQAQLASGAWGWNADFSADNLQATAQAVQALALSEGSRARARRAERRATRWLVSQQQPNGGWLYTAELENPLLNAEVALALHLSGTAAGERDGLDADGVAATARPLVAGGAGQPPLAEPTSF